MAQGMFGSLFGETTAQNEEDLRRKQAMELARLPGGDLGAFQAAQAGNMAGAGIRGIVGGLTGADTRTPGERTTASIEEVRQAIIASGIDPTDFKRFYPALIRELGKRGMVAEAREMVKEFQDMQDKALGRQVQQGQLARQTAKDVATNAQAEERNAIARERLGTQGAESVQLLTRLDDTTDPVARANIIARLNALAQGKGVKFMDLTDRVEVVDAATGQTMRTAAKGLAPKDEAKAVKADAALETAYEATKRQLQSMYDAAVKLHNHAGLAALVGPLSGRAADPTAAGRDLARTALGAEGRSALASYDQVVGASFIEGLNQLKAASKTGSTGLGQVTEIEGAKVQNANAALNPYQNAESFRGNLGVYLAKMAEAGKALDVAYQRDGGTALKPLSERALGVPTPAAPAAQPKRPNAPVTVSPAPAGAVAARSATRKFNPATGKIE